MNIAKPSSSVKPLYSSSTKHVLEVLGLFLCGVVIAISVIVIVVSKRTEPQRPKSSRGFEFTLSGNDVLTKGRIYPPGYYEISETGTLRKLPCLPTPCIYNTSLNGRDGCRKGPNSVLVLTNKIYKLIPEDEDDVFAESIIYVIAGGGCEGIARVPMDIQVNNTGLTLETGGVFLNSFTKSKQFWILDEFCLDHEDHVVLCPLENKTDELPEDPNPRWVYMVRGVGLLISVPCFLATVLVYTLVHRQKLHDKALICYVASLTVAYLGFGLIQVASDSFSSSLCIGLAFTVQFTLLTSFFWLNVMCFDIWWAFSGLKPLRKSFLEIDQIKFLTYSLYAWGLPLLILGVALFMDFYPGIPASALRPGMGEIRCFFKESDAALVYLYIPIGVMVYLNTAMFLATSLRLRAHFKSAEVLYNRESSLHCENVVRHKADIQRFSLYLKLFLVMGVNWVLELLSFFLGGSLVMWLIIDVTNALQGITVLYLSVCQHRTLRSLRQRLCPNLRLFKEQGQSVKTSSFQHSSRMASVRKSGSRNQQFISYI